MPVLLVCGLLLVSSARCSDSDSFESSFNGVELTPFYDTIIFSDIADIMKDFESSGLPLFSKIPKEDSESDENVEDLLREYQEYLDKEQKQRKDYIERTKLKNKVPLLRHDRFSKINFGNGGKHNDKMFNIYKNSYYNLQDTHKSKSALAKAQYNQYGGVEASTAVPRDSNELGTFKRMMLSEEGRAPSLFSKMMFPQPQQPPCCKNGQFVSLGVALCKQCATAKDHSRTRFEPKLSLSSDDKRSDNLENDFADPDDALNIRIKIDVQLPKVHDRLERHQSAIGPDDGQREFPLAIRMPSAFYNVPVPLNLYGYKKTSKSFSSPLHKLTIHKKKKSKSTSGGKKHRKKVITFHNIKMDPQQIYEAHYGKTSSDDDAQPTDPTDAASITTDTFRTNKTTAEHSDNLHLNETQTEENVFLLVNISNSEAEESNKTNNSIETEYTNPKLNVTTETSLLVRRKRALSNANNNKSGIVALKTTSENDKKDKIISENATKASEKTIKFTTKIVQVNKTDAREKQDVIKSKVSKSDIAKKNDRMFYIEEDLLYWPNKTGNQSKVVSKNITTIILESESKKGKLNLTKELMRNNHTRVLEKAIFGDVDWNDVDAVAPAFISFIGKYIEGALTFCSELICHSMKCARKVCQHRVCTPSERFNNRGHCVGANDTDSVATMESIMDLPTNIVFEIVDILQDKMVGKMFGKMTLCISPKCITFVSSKKRFIKYKCTAKELSPRGHCVNTKEGKSA